MPRMQVRLSVISLGHLRNLMNAEHHKTFRRGLEEFNTERFFEAHEVWEEVWLASAEPEKRFLQGIIQIAAAFHHYQRDNLLGTRSLLEAGLGRLRDFPADQGGISLDLLCVAAGEWATALRAGRDPGRAQFPKIQMVPGAPKEAKSVPQKGKIVPQEE
jgi:uncharacterized protein